VQRVAGVHREAETNVNRTKKQRVGAANKICGIWLRILIVSYHVASHANVCSLKTREIGLKGRAVTAQAAGLGKQTSINR
jgi:hypothetical protein